MSNPLTGISYSHIWLSRLFMTIPCSRMTTHVFTFSHLLPFLDKVFWNASFQWPVPCCNKIVVIVRHWQQRVSPVLVVVTIHSSRAIQLTSSDRGGHTVIYPDGWDSISSRVVSGLLECRGRQQDQGKLKCFNDSIVLVFSLLLEYGTKGPQ